MELVLDQSAFLKALGHVHNVIEARNVIPALSHILLSAKNDELVLTATDNEIMISETIAGAISKEGEVLAPGNLVYGIVQKCDSGAQISLCHHEDRLQVKSGRSHFKLQYLPTDQFPRKVGEGALDHEFSLPVAQLRRIIERTRFAMSHEETRYYLNGLYLHMHDDGASLCAVATDGHRLSRVQIAAPEGAKNMPGIIIPRKGVQTVYKIFEGAEGDVVVSLSSSLIRFSSGNIVMTAKLIDGKFPEYQAVIPSNNTKTMRVDSEPFSQAVARVGLVTSMRGQGVRMIVENNLLTLKASSLDQGDASDELEIDYQHERIDVGYNMQYLLVITHDTIAKKAEFCWSDENSPTLIRDCDDPEALYVLMPMRV